MVEEINWTTPAVVDLDNIFSHISKDSEDIAKGYVNRLIDSTEVLKQFPRMGRKVPEFDDDSVIELLVVRHRIIYMIDPEEQVFVLGVIHGKRDFLLQKNPSN